MGTNRGERVEQSNTTIGAVKRSRRNQSDTRAVQQPQRGKHVTAPNRKLMGRGLRRQAWLKAFIKLAGKCRDAFRGKAHTVKGEFGGWENNDSQLLRVSANARQIENAIVSGDVKAVYALAGYGFIQHSEEAFNALRDDNHTASAPSP